MREHEKESAGEGLGERWRQRVDDKLGDPIWWNDVLQLVKTVVAVGARHAGDDRLDLGGL